jgi:hypothetical protein
MANILDLASYVQQSGAIGKEAGQKSRLAKLYSSALSAPDEQRDSFLPQMAAESPEAAMQAQGQFSDMRKQAYDDLGREAGMFVALAQSDPQSAQAAYSRLAQKAQAAGHPVPPTYDPKMLPMIEKLAGVVGQAASGVQSTYIDAQGNRVAIMRDGSTQVLGQNAPSNQIIDTGDGFYGVNKGNLQAAPVMVGGPQAQAQPDAQPQPGPMLDPTQDYPQLAANFPGTQVSSLFRSPAHNAEVGGVPNSQHMKGTAGDFVIPKAEQAAFIAKAKAMGYEVIPEGDHVHVELPPGAKASAGFGAGQQLRSTPKPPSEIEQERLRLAQEASARDAQRLTLQQQAAARAATSLTTGKPADDAKAQKIAAARADALDSVTQAISGIDGLMKGGGFENLGTFTGDALSMIPHTKTKDASNALETVKNQVLLTTLGKLKALSATGASGFGALSNQEGKILQNSIANLETAQSHEAIVNNLKIIRGTLQRAAGLIGGNAAPAASQAPQGGHVDDLLSKYGVK